MANTKNYLISLLLNFIDTEIIKIQNQYNNHSIEFNIGDTVYYNSINNIVIKGKIVDIDDFTNNGNRPLGLVYYWVVPKSISRNITQKIKYLYCSLLNRPYIPHPMYFTNSVLFGVDIFKTETEAENASILYNARFYLNELLSVAGHDYTFCKRV